MFFQANHAIPSGLFSHFHKSIIIPFLRSFFTQHKLNTKPLKVSRLSEAFILGDYMGGHETRPYSPISIPYSLNHNTHQAPICYDHLPRLFTFQELLHDYRSQRRGLDLILRRFGWDSDSVTHLAVDLDGQLN
jgi:hypothetical protein